MHPKLKFWLDPFEKSSHSSGFDWVDSKVTKFIFVYRDSSSIDSFKDRHHLLREKFSKFSSSPTVGSSFFTSSDAPTFPYIGPRPLLASGNGLVQPPVPRSGRFMICLIASREGFLPERSCLYISRPRGEMIFRVCLFYLSL